MFYICCLCVMRPFIGPLLSSTSTIYTYTGNIQTKTTFVRQFVGNQLMRFRYEMCRRTNTSSSLCVHTHIYDNVWQKDECGKLGTKRF
jgi:hypothetical protein